MELNESDSDIENLIGYLDQRILEFKKKYPSHELLKLMSELYRTDIADWYECHKIHKKMTNRQKEERLKNDILDLIFIINTVLKK